MKKKIIGVILALFIAAMLSITVQAKNSEYIKVIGYDPNADYMLMIYDALQDGSPYAMEMGRIYEQQRNLKIVGLNMKYAQTDYFDRFETAEEILNALNEKNKEVTAKDSEPSGYSDDDLDLLARIINAEAGCTWIPDWVQLAVGSVVLNRVNSPLYPNTIKEVIYQPGQYGPVYNGMIDKRPERRCVENARYLLENGSQIPANVFGQSGSTWGKEVYATYYDSILGSTTYFTYD